jgi:hypothetical protein
MVSLSASQARHLALSVLLNRLRYLLSKMWVSLSCKIRLAELCVISGVLIALRNFFDGVVLSILNILQPLSDWHQVSIHSV